MLAFLVVVNGQRQCTVGLQPESSCTITIAGPGNPEEGAAFLDVGGMEKDDHVRWSVLALQPGDEISVTIVETDVVDAPRTRKTVEELDRWLEDMNETSRKRSKPRTE